jgi:UDP-N-acetylglucosamine acyltransferase|tara:strand:+ start:3455 stop:4711 length:1257 start_codon:yes stop_codon:yes gene_type:complete
VPIDIPATLDRLNYRYPSFLVDAVVDHEPGRRIVGMKNVTVNEEFFQGHFPGTPLMPGVLMIEAFAQVATILFFQDTDRPAQRAWLQGVDAAKFRHQVVPGDRLRLEVTMGEATTTEARAHAKAFVEDELVAEAKLLFGLTDADVDIDPSARVAPGATLGAGSVIGPHAVIGEHVTLGRRCQIGASAVVDGWTEIGDDTKVFPCASIGLIPQDLKFHGESSRLKVGARNVFREFVTVHRGTDGGGGETRIGDDNLFMAYAHIAHDCRVGGHTIFGNGATLGGHVSVEDYATISALSGVHQFCRVGAHAFVGGFSVVTRDALPFARTVGNRARVYGVNTIGLIRRGFSPELITKLKRTYRYLLQSKLNTSQALVQIESDPALACAEVDYLVTFIRSSKRGVGLRRAGRRRHEDEPLDDE